MNVAIPFLTGGLCAGLQLGWILIVGAAAGLLWGALDLIASKRSI
jgi:hypothetical protein